MTTAQPSQALGGAQRLFAGSNFAEMYENELVGPIFDPWVGDLFAAVDLRPGERVLDVACGTGIVARRAKERVGEAGTVVGVDVNPQMLAVARQVAPTVDWREGDAGALPLAEGEQFDVVLCQQGMQFFPDLGAAARQMRRATADGGRLAVSTWRPDEESPVLRRLRDIAERHVGPVSDRRHGLGEAGPLAAALRDAGFRNVDVSTRTRTLRFNDGLVFARLNAMALVNMSAIAGSLDEAARQQRVSAIVDDSAELVRRHTDAQGFAYEIGTNLLSARA